ncbi:type II toxin-antitoxin system VapC family toxin [Candidatus Latescibacterota bacterium]
MIFVVDTSALMRLYIPDGPVPDGMEAALRSAEVGNDSLLSPDLLLAECGQVLHKKRTEQLLTDDELSGLVDSILDLPIRLVPHHDLLRSACDLAARCGLTVYDALFLALAQRHSAPLLTADGRLRRAAAELNL